MRRKLIALGWLVVFMLGGCGGRVEWKGMVHPPRPQVAAGRRR